MKDHALSSLRLALTLGILSCATPPVIVEAEAERVAIPSPGAILEDLRAERPRLPSPIPDPLHRRLLESDTGDLPGILVKATGDIMGRQPIRYVAGGNLRRAGVVDRLSQSVTLLGLRYEITGDRKVLDRLWKDLEATTRFPDWSQDRCIDTGPIAAMIGVAYDRYHDDWDPAQRATLRQAVIDKALRPALAAYRDGEGRLDKAPRNPRDWVVVEHNWNLVCNSGFARAALAVAEDEPKLAGQVLRHALVSVQKSFAGYAPDGGWDEGPLYWEFATNAAVALLRSLDGAFGGDFGLSRLEGFSETGFYPIYNSGPTGIPFNYSDSEPRSNEMLFLAWLAGRFDEPLFFAPFALGQAELRALVPEAAGAVRSLDRLPLDRHFRGAGVASMRSEWSPRALYVATKAGDNAASHAQLDQGTFVLDADGQRWVVDLGKDDYSLPGYLGVEKGWRWGYYVNRAEGHNTLVIEPGSGPSPTSADQDPRAAARFVSFDSDGSGARAELDLTPVYGDRARSVRRIVRLVDRK